MRATRSRAHIALASCATLPELDEDERLVVGPLQQAGARVTPAVWDDATIDWDAFDLVVVRSTWDYTARREQFVAWARSVPRLANPAEVIAWNTDKRYLADLHALGLPTVPTRWFGAGDPLELPAAGVHVIKPSVGAGSLDVERFELADATERAAARAHAERLLGEGRTVMVQPYLESVDRAGEAGLVLLHGEHSHSITKGPMLGGGREPVAGLYKSETIDARVPSAVEMDLARRTIAALPFDRSELLYARVDMLADEAGQPIIIELELTEPSLFLATAPGAEERFAAAILDAAQRSRSGQD